LAAFATPEDVATAQERDLDAADTATVSYLLDVATDMIKDYTEQEIEATTGVVDTLRAGNGTWLLSQIPVTAVTTVTVDGDAFTDFDVDLKAGILTRTDSSWDTCDSVVVTYDSGYATIPRSIQGVCVDIAKRAFENPAGIQRDDLNTASQWLGLTQENERILQRYRAR